MSLELVTQTLDTIKPPEVRIEAWKTLLGKMFIAETSLLNQVRDDFPKTLENKFPANPTKEDIALLPHTIKAIEDEVALLTKKKNQTIKERKEYTSKLDSVTERMMLPEKTYDNYINQLKAYLIPLKRVEADEARKAALRAKDLSDTRYNIQVQYNGNVSEYMRYIQEQVTRFYQHALDNVAADKKTEYVDACKKLLTLDSFKNKPCPVFQDAEKQAISNEIYSNWNPQEFLDKFYSELEDTFDCFETDKLEIEQAKQKRIDAENAAKLEIKEEVVVNDNLAKLESRVEAPAPIIATKALKTVYKIDMEHSEENMIKIIRAFFANLVGCMANYRGNDAFDISINKMGELLCTLKNKDANFAAEGITFKSEDKI